MFKGFIIDNIYMLNLDDMTVVLFFDMRHDYDLKLG